MGRSCVVTRWKPELRWVATCGNSLPHTTFLRTHRPVRHLLICRAEAQTVDLTYVAVQFSVVSFSRPCNIRSAGHATLVTFHNQAMYPSRVRAVFDRGNQRARQVNWKAKLFMPLATMSPSIRHRLTTIFHISLSLITRPALVPGSSLQMTSTRESESRQPPRVRSSGDHNR